ncbi:MAG: hypothetical protein U0792_19455 [Gemmataceae bacterium]
MVAILSSIGGAIAYLALLVLLYLFVDLLVSRGLIPSYTQLSPRQQRDLPRSGTNALFPIGKMR